MPSTRTRPQPDVREPDVNELAHALAQRMTGEIPITPEDREPPAEDQSADEPVRVRERQPA